MRNISLPKQTDSRPVLVLFGPTASGKTALAEKLFTGKDALCRAEIISADSMQVYRGMDIGTAKPPPALREKLPHHLVDIRSPDEQFNVGDFVRLADKACLEAASRSALPVVLGGTGFYLKNFMYGLPAAPPSDIPLREKLKAELAEKGPEALSKRLSALDPESAQRIHLNDSYRLVRALEVCISSGRPLSSFAQNTGKRASYHFLSVGLRLSREELYNKINERCEDMFKQGLAEEVSGLYKKGFTPDNPGLRAIGYREFFVKNQENGQNWQLSGDIKGIKELIAQNSRRYAKRQETFFSGIKDVQWISTADCHTALDLLSSLIHTEFNVKP